MGRASNAEKQPTGRGPEGCVKNGLAAALLVGYISIQICALLAPCRRPIFNATKPKRFRRRCTRPSSSNPFAITIRQVPGLRLYRLRGYSSPVASEKRLTPTHL